MVGLDRAGAGASAASARELDGADKMTEYVDEGTTITPTIDTDVGEGGLNQYSEFVGARRAKVMSPMSRILLSALLLTSCVDLRPYDGFAGVAFAAWTERDSAAHLRWYVSEGVRGRSVLPFGGGRYVESEYLERREVDGHWIADREDSERMYARLLDANISARIRRVGLSTAIEPLRVEQNDVLFLDAVSVRATDDDSGYEEAPSEREGLLWVSRAAGGVRVSCILPKSADERLRRCISGHVLRCVLGSDLLGDG